MATGFRREDVGGVHAKYLAHCRRQLWMYLHGIRPESRSDLVAVGEFVADTTYPRKREIDLGAVRIDWMDEDGNPHEVKSSLRHNEQHDRQAELYLLRLEDIGMSPTHAVIHYPRTRRTRRVAWNPDARARAQQTVEAVLAVADLAVLPARLERYRCKGCAYTDLCWA